MSKRLKLTAAFLAAVLFMSAVVSCGGSSEGTPKAGSDTTEATADWAPRPRRS